VTLTDDVVQKPLEVVCRVECGKAWRTWIEKNLECCKQSLMSDSDEISKDQNANRNMNSKHCAHEASNRN
jgi:hypothetical protein